MKIQVITILLIFTLFSCSTTSEPQLISINDIYQIEVPADMSPTDINDEASLQYANLFKEKYLMIIHEDKNEFTEFVKPIEVDKVIEKFTDLVVQGYEQSFNNEAYVYDISFNGLIGKKVEIDGVFEDIPIAWHAVLIEGEENLYQICFWTLKSRENKHMEQLFNSAKTFNEL